MEATREDHHVEPQEEGEAMTEVGETQTAGRGETQRGTGEDGAGKNGT